MLACTSTEAHVSVTGRAYVLTTLSRQNTEGQALLLSPPSPKPCHLKPILPSSPTELEVGGGD